ncbi:hypothetical protein [Flavihumibacter petaseus]|uniref:Uncharacterized protein n=1 Tax=Flavihumibacter petaseus NBRC 106054 TaxID=1220578 RepID=A0A0E9N1P4_9BACT|nr:hypothetical protein [Flavihumibacter petaseus]GAO43774.1 hypothetical protein FPE01S_02_08800 [Flavihumibacter petaseus NBRC 106054]
MDYKQFEGHTPGPWFPVEFGGYWNIHDEPFYEGTNLLDKESSDQADVNAKLAAAATQLLSRCIELERWKAEATIVQHRWDRVLDAAQKSPAFKLGCDIPSRVAEMIEENKRLMEALDAMLTTLESLKAAK